MWSLDTLSRHSVPGYVTCFKNPLYSTCIYTFKENGTCFVTMLSMFPFFHRMLYMYESLYIKADNYSTYKGKMWTFNTQSTFTLSTHSQCSPLSFTGNPHLSDLE